MEVNSKQSTSSRVLNDITTFTLYRLLIIARNSYSCSLHDLFCQSMIECFEKLHSLDFGLSRKNSYCCILQRSLLSINEKSVLTLFALVDTFSQSMKERSYTLKCFCFYTITSSFEDKANTIDIDNEYPVKFRYFAELCHEPRGTYLHC